MNRGIYWARVGIAALLVSGFSALATGAPVQERGAVRPSSSGAVAARPDAARPVARRPGRSRTVATRPASMGPLAIAQAPAKAWIRLRRGGLRVYASPSRAGRRRGLVAGRNLALPLLERRAARGCRLPWVRIGPEAWICPRRFRVEPWSAVQGPVFPQLRSGRLLPHAYLVARRRVSVRAAPRPDARVVRLLREASGVVARRKRAGPGGPWRPTRLGWVPASALRFVRPSRLRGVSSRAGLRLPISWIHGASAWVTRRPMLSRRARVGGLAAYSRVQVVETRTVGRRRFARIGPDRWVPADRVRTARRRIRPAGVGPRERWIHVSLADWTLVAYEGDVPVFATLVSRGYRTPRGHFRVIRKLAIGTMRFYTRSGQYEAEAVPWIVYFKPRYALHTAYWHDGFGVHASHGCVNLSPADARWIFEWTRPSLPRGWIQVYPVSLDPGTHVVIE